MENTANYFRKTNEVVGTLEEQKADYAKLVQEQVEPKTLIEDVVNNGDSEAIIVNSKVNEELVEKLENMGVPVHFLPQKTNDELKKEAYEDVAKNLSDMMGLNVSLAEDK